MSARGECVLANCRFVRFVVEELGHPRPQATSAPGSKRDNETGKRRRRTTTKRRMTQATDEFDCTIKITDLLQKISPKETNIKAIGTFCTTNVLYADAIVQQLLDSINNVRIISRKRETHPEKAPPKLSILYFFVVERISKTAVYATKLSTHLFQIVLKIIPEDATGNQHLETVEKVVRAWKEGRVFPSAVLKTVETHLKNIRDAAGFMPLSEVERANAMKRMEQDREGVRTLLETLAAMRLWKMANKSIAKESERNGVDETRSRRTTR